MARNKQAATYCVNAGQWLVMQTRQDYPPVVLTVENDEQSALEWRAELVRRISSSSDARFYAFTESSGRLFINVNQVSRLMVGDGLRGPDELLVLLAHNPMPSLIRTETHLHGLLAGRFPE